jgi:hypothetical protein
MRKGDHPFAAQYASCNVKFFSEYHEKLGSFIGPTAIFLPKAVL